MSNLFHKSIADKFNKKKTISNDLSRISNIHKKTNTFIPLLKNSPIRNNPFKLTNNSIFNFDNIQMSTSVGLNILRENNNDKLPKIMFDNVIIPDNSNAELLEINKILKNNFYSNIEMQCSEIKNNNINQYLHQTQLNNIDNNIQNNIDNNKLDDITTTKINENNKINTKKNLSNQLFEINYKNIRKYIPMKMHNEKLDYFADYLHEDTANNLFNNDFFSKIISTKISDSMNMDINELTKININDSYIYDNYETLDNNEIIRNNDEHINNIKLNIKKIYHVYQEIYNNNIKPTGFGDFIRSCFFIIQFCLKNGFEYEILINHPISLFLKNYSSTYKNNCKNTIFLQNNANYFIHSNWITTNFYNFHKRTYNEQFVLSDKIYNDYIHHLTTLPSINKSIFSYNILFPITNITLYEINIVKNIFEPTLEMTSYINKTLQYLNFTNNQFIVIQIRSGDKYLKGDNNSIFKSQYFNKIVCLINNLVSSDCEILLIADNNEIKYLLQKLFPYFKMSFKNITHIGEGVFLEEDQLKNTLLDFYLMSKSSYIYSITSYPHGSGFSYWCSKLYNIPYNCFYIEN